eukprot:maker-scaffold47_size466558-snap-gene-3.35 protein:Tk04179 transcript:maker-scaffold47_size466558-snap-gene-3.35-mRNA-1 annotation:"antibacterial peptide pbsip"
MKTTTSMLLLTFICCLSLAIAAKECYEHASTDKMDEMGTVKECPKDTKNCMKKTMSVGDKWTYDRACGVKTDKTEECKTEKSDDGKTMTETCYCNSDKCNPATRIGVATLSLLTAVVVKIIL